MTAEEKRHHPHFRLVPDNPGFHYAVRATELDLSAVAEPKQEEALFSVETLGMLGNKKKPAYGEGRRRRVTGITVGEIGSL